MKGKVASMNADQLKDLIVGTLNDNVILAALGLLNKQLEDHLFVYHTPLLMDTERVREFLDSEYRGQEQIHLVLNVGKDIAGYVFISDHYMSGNHYTYLHFDVKKMGFTYSDSLKWKVPRNLELAILPLLKEVIRRRPVTNLSSIQEDTIRHTVCHVQCENAGQFVVHQKCSIMCGIAAILPCVAALDSTLWQAVTGKISEESPADLQLYKSNVFSDVTGHSNELRTTIIKWLIKEEIHIEDLQW